MAVLNGNVSDGVTLTKPW